MEHAAVDCLTWLTTHEDADARLPLDLPMDPGCRVGVAMKALDATLIALSVKNDLLNQVLNDGPRPPPPPAYEATASPSQAAAPHAAASSPAECVCCFENLKAAGPCALVPCGHANVCAQCGGSLTECPICRTPIERAMRIFAD